MSGNQRPSSIADTPWVVQSDGRIEALFGKGSGAITATVRGQEIGTDNPLGLSVRRWDRVIHESEHQDMTAAMDSVIAVVMDEWAEDDRLAQELEWVAITDQAEDERELTAAAVAGGCATEVV